MVHCWKSLSLSLACADSTARRIWSLASPVSSWVGNLRTSECSAPRTTSDESPLVGSLGGREGDARFKPKSRALHSPVLSRSGEKSHLVKGTRSSRKRASDRELSLFLREGRPRVSSPPALLGSFPANSSGEGGLGGQYWGREVHPSKRPEFESKQTVV